MTHAAIFRAGPMFVTQNFVFTDGLMPEGMAGVPMVAKLLGSLVRGQPAPAAPPGSAPSAASLAAHGKPVLALVCDPRSWYLTLWRQGCEGMGSLFHRMGDESRWQELRKRAAALPTALAAGGAAAGLAVELPPEWGADRALDTWYANPRDVGAFREWLRAVMAVRALRGLVSPDYARSPLSRSCGFMTFQYNQLFIHNPNDLGMPATHARALQQLDKSKGLLTQSVRMEQLSADLPGALQALGVPLDEKQVAAVEAVQANLPPLRREWFRFYGLDELALIDDRERFICARLRFSMEPARAHLRAGGKPAAEAAEPSSADGGAAAPAARPAGRRWAAKRAAAAATPSAPAQPDPAEIARQERIANIRRLQEERLAQRRASGKLQATRPAAKKMRDDDDDGLTLLQDFDED